MKINSFLKKIIYLVKNFDLLKTKIDSFIDFSELCLEAKDLHKNTFDKYRNSLIGKDCAVIGSGPTLDKWIPPLACTQIGVNGTFRAEQLNLDFLFIQDYEKYQFQILNGLKSEKTKYFFGFHYMVPSVNVIPFFESKRFNADRYYFYDNPKYIFPYNFTTDISQKPFITYGSTIFIALQFALFCHPKKIYIVGCDCSKGHFKNNPNLNETTPIEDVVGIDNIVSGWKKFAQFAHQFYPDIEIVSVNPVGLKGLFNDMYI